MSVAVIRKIEGLVQCLPVGSIRAFGILHDRATKIERRNMKNKTLVMVFLTLFLFAFRVQSNAQSIPNYVKAKHKQILRRYLAQRRGLKFEAMPDNQGYSGINHYQNYAVGDFNGDGNEDFVVLLKKSRSKMTIVIFNGPLSEQTSPAFYLELPFVNNDQIFWMNDSSFGRRILVGPPETDVGTIIIWRRGRYITE